MLSAPKKQYFAQGNQKQTEIAATTANSDG
jgi:hypothetical protein